MAHITKFNNDEETRLHDHARKLCRQFNNCDDERERQSLLIQMFNKVGERLFIIPPLTIDTGNISFGDNCMINSDVKFIDMGGITIGNNVGISVGTVLCSTNHPCNPLTLDTFECIKEPIVIEDDVWIGANCTILGNVTIGKGAIIGAGSVVTKNIPAGEVWAGNPARFIETVEEYIKKKEAKNKD